MTQRDVGDLMDRFRGCMRALWNDFLRDGADDERLDVFQQVQDELFDELVLRPLGKPGVAQCPVVRGRRVALPYLTVRPGSHCTRILIERLSEQNRYWDEPPLTIGPDDARLVFVEYFDWDPRAMIDLQYYRVRISDFATHAHLDGREALIEVHDTRIFYTDD